MDSEGLSTEPDNICRWHFRLVVRKIGKSLKYVHSMQATTNTEWQDLPMTH